MKEASTKNDKFAGDDLQSPNGACRTHITSSNAPFQLRLMPLAENRKRRKQEKKNDQT